MKRPLGIFLTMLACASVCSPAFSDDIPWAGHTLGRPKNFERGDGASYAVWHVSDGGFRLDVTTAGARRHFRGKITLDGEGHFGKVVQWKGAGEAESEEKNDNWFKRAITRGKNDKEISFDVVSEDRNVSGIYFRIEGTGKLRWELGIGGPKDSDTVLRDPRLVKIGQEGHPAPAIPFQTWAHPST
jgi:hypothetical protein